MADDRMTMLDRQKEAFCIGMDQSRVTYKLLAYKLGSGESTVRTWANGQAEMPFDKIDAFVDTFGVEVASLLLGDGLSFTRVIAPDNHDDLAARCADYSASVLSAHHPDSECGTEIGPRESVALARRAAAVRGAA